MNLPETADRPEALAPPGRRVPRQALVRFAVLVALVLAGIAVLRWTPLAGMLNEKNLLAYRDLLRQSWWAAPALVASYVLLCPLGFPASPMMITGGIVFGAVWGSVLNVVGTSLGGAATYFVGRALGRDFVSQLGGKRLKKIERQVAKRGFWGLVGVRFLPFPFALVNYCAALAGIAPGLFLTTTVIGLTPINIVYTYFTAVLLEVGGPARKQVYARLMIVSAILAFVTFFPQVWSGRKRRRRYAELLERREKRQLATAG
jgi:phospholipase D1/2